MTPYAAAPNPSIASPSGREPGIGRRRLDLRLTTRARRGRSGPWLRSSRKLKLHDRRARPGIQQSRKLRRDDGHTWRRWLPTWWRRGRPVVLARSDSRWLAERRTHLGYRRRQITEHELGLQPEHSVTQASELAIPALISAAAPRVPAAIDWGMSTIRSSASSTCGGGCTIHTSGGSSRRIRSCSAVLEPGAQPVQLRLEQSAELHRSERVFRVQHRRAARRLAARERRQQWNRREPTRAM
jgi:hypothetical protein